MKTLLILFAILFISLSSNAGDKKDPLTIEMIEGTPTKQFNVITPISSDKSSLEDAYADLRKKAAKLGADAVIEYECDKGSKARGGGIFGIGHKTTIKAGCAGKAIKWI